MCNLFLKYFIKQKKNILFVIILVLVGFTVSSITKIENNKVKEKVISGKENVIQTMNYEIEEIDKELKNSDISEEEKNDLESTRELDVSTISSYKKHIQEIKDENWNKLYEKEINHLKRNGQFIGIGLEGYDVNPLTVEITYETLKYLNDNNIPTSHPLDLQRTEFEQPRTSEESKLLDRYSKKFLVGTSHRIWDFFSNNLIFLYIFMIVIVPGILFSKLEDSQNKTIRFLKISGVSKLKIISSGLFVGGFVTIFLGIFIPLVFAGVEFFVSGSSSFKYPIVAYILKADYFSLMSFGYKIVPMSEVLQKSMILLILYGLFIFLVTSLISYFVKSGVKSAILSFGLIATLQMFNKWYNPFSYWRVGKIADGSINILYKSISYSFNKSCYILGIGICILVTLLVCINFLQDIRRSKNA